MSFQLNLSALTESARDRLARLDASGTALRDRFRSPPLRSAVPSSTHSPSSPGDDRVGLVSHGVVVGPSGESSSALRLPGGGGYTLPIVCDD